MSKGCATWDMLKTLVRFEICMFGQTLIRAEIFAQAQVQFQVYKWPMLLHMKTCAQL